MLQNALYIGRPIFVKEVDASLPKIADAAKGSVVDAVTKMSASCKTFNSIRQHGGNFKKNSCIVLRNVDK
jgi:hypothetical protein